MKNTKKEVMVPREIPSYMPPPPYTFPLAKYYVTSFKTDRDAMAGMLPEKVVPMAGAEDHILLQMNNFTTYWEAVVSIPVIFKSNDGDVKGIYLSQLYLGSIIPEGSSLPMLLGQIGAGYPKRDAIFTVSGFGEDQTEVKFDRWGTTVADMKHKMGDAVTDFSNLPFGSDLTDMTAFLLKAIPSADGSGWDALQLTSPKGDLGKVTRVNKVETTFKGDLVLDSGRVLPVKEQFFSLYYEVEGMGLSHAEILNDYLTD
jgi:acetoacetate decarboxylase